ncbi:activin receptor type-2A [Strongylocentrotus purpuratus]|uniref:Serine/threonine-protein kinase receptor n=1 Tax=Strongylocentrotus purpuratus TaxID=7668 RepID=A0A7M7MYN9_STRPU|nr:activin receptor type-2A [Strongylocentrotus purpuratus]
MAGKDPLIRLCELFLFLSIAVLLVEGASVNLPLGSTHCHLYSSQECEKDGTKCGNTTEECDNKEAEIPSCYVLWKNETSSGGGVDVMMRGCWQNQGDCLDMDYCMSSSPADQNLFFCCCVGNLCNMNFSFLPTPEPTPTVTQTTVTGSNIDEKKKKNEMLTKTILYSIVPIVAIALVIIMLYWMCRRHRYHSLIAIPTTEPTPSPMNSLPPIQLLEIKARGRFGAVWKASCLNDIVAVKVFPIQDRNSWANEREIYSLPHMHHENLLHFIATEKHGEGLEVEYWLISEFHHHGSLCDYLKANVISWKELCGIAFSMAKGLAYLHEDIPPTTAIPFVKHSVAHRDFKSKNVLIKNNTTACIADFGLACVFEAGKNPGDTHGQVGTRRYMAPEVLEGAIQFKRDAFLRIDMYAFGLVLWELVTRCTVQDGPVPEYRLPFEEELGQGTSLEDMQEWVVVKRKRPVISDHWLKHRGLELLCETIEECWDQDAEARLSAGCVEERIAQFSHSHMNGHMNGHHPVSPTPLIMQTMHNSTSFENTGNTESTDIALYRNSPSPPPKESNL